MTEETGRRKIIMAKKDKRLLKDRMAELLMAILTIGSLVAWGNTLADNERRSVAQNSPGRVGSHCAGSQSYLWRDHRRHYGVW